MQAPEVHLKGLRDILPENLDDAGLRGYRVGNVMVSEKHCGFVVNMGGGTCEEAKAVINHVREEVEKQFGVTLEMEVRKLGWN